MSDTYPLVPLRDVLIPVSRPERVEPTSTYHILGAHWYAAGLYTKDVRTGAEIQADKVYRVERDDFVYNRLFAWKGSFALATAENGGCYVSNEFPCFNVNPERAIGQYLWRYFSRESAWDEALGLSTGGTPTSRNRLKEEKLLAMRIPLPPLAEQRRVMARVEALAAKIAEARGLRRQAIDDIGILVHRATADRIANHEWMEFPLGTLLREGSQNGLALHPSDSPPGVPILRISAATSRTDATVDESDTKYAEISDKDVERYRLCPGDLLACRFNGNLRFVGRFAIYTGETGSIRVYPDKLIRFRMDTSKVSPNYAVRIMNSPLIRKRVEAFCATTAGNIGISAGNLKTIPMPVPPLNEQQQIVAYLDSVQAKADAVRRLQTETAAELGALLPAVLYRAFRGEL